MESGKLFARLILWADATVKAKLFGLGQAFVGMRHVADFAGEAYFAEHNSIFLELQALGGRTNRHTNRLSR